MRDPHLSRRGVVGLSLANIEELEETRRLLISWSKRSRNPGEANRLEEGETFAPRNLEHIQHVKDDRLKQMANLIVMTALGYVYEDKNKRWNAAFPACQVILFENLSRYRFSQDRPRRENSRLMKWAHRSIPKAVHMRGEVYGLQVGDIAAEYSSRFHAKTGAPGIRCHILREEDLAEDAPMKKKLIDTKFVTEAEAKQLRQGDYVPLPGGEYFVSFSGRNKKLTFIQADINAAQNLQKRFWQQRTELFRLACRAAQEEGQETYLPKTERELQRVQEILGPGRLVPTSQEHVYEWLESTKLVKRKPAKARKLEADTEEQEGEDWELEETEQERKTFKTFFCDPSGFFFPQTTWMPQVEFWSKVTGTLTKHLRERLGFSR